jgi:TetR/AcrR family transcriptional regulator, mexCD-oprJ operon repressor
MTAEEPATTAPPAGYRQATAQRNVAAILDAAGDLLERRARTSVAAVAARAGVSRVTVYAHFASWEAILEAVVERALTRTMAVIEEARPEAGPPLEALDRVVAVGWRELARNAALAQAAAGQLSSDTITRTHQAALGRLAGLIERGRADGSFRTDLPAGWLAAAALALLHACGGEVRAGRLGADQAPRVIAVTIRELLAGPATGQPPPARPGP